MSVYIRPIVVGGTATTEPQNGIDTITSDDGYAQMAFVADTGRLPPR
jgi:hypothetical protein